LRLRLGAAVLATTALASGLAFATPAFADNEAPSTVSAVEPYAASSCIGPSSAWYTGGGFKISTCMESWPEGKYKNKILSYLDVAAVPSKKKQKKCQILGQTTMGRTYATKTPIGKPKRFSCTTGRKLISITKPKADYFYRGTGTGINDGKVRLRFKGNGFFWHFFPALSA
jgi:hypothetical protein